ncbi:hypothetical protein OIO90_001550 [Microbotryomycetes sp. JL221]|nr:hypothetical protein OIO90_001550 [Microbotryomycetes sp. JL221]
MLVSTGRGGTTIVRPLFSSLSLSNLTRPTLVQGNISNTSRRLTMSQPRKFDDNGIAIPSPSASVVLIAPLNEKTSDGYDYRVLLLKRNAKSSTFVSAHVFPGGNMDPIDSDTKAWQRFFSSPGSFSPEETKAQAMKLCAVRETFEESGILLLEGNGKGKERWNAIKEEDRKRWRDKVHGSGSAFVELFSMLTGEDSAVTRPGVSTLQPRGNWVTPASLKRRFDTMFYITILPPSSTPLEVGQKTHVDHVATADNGETVLADWLTPLESIQRTLLHTKTADQGEAPSENSVILFPPQFYLLAELIKHQSWKTLTSQIEIDASGNALVEPRSVHAYEPEISPCQDVSGQDRVATVLLGDPLHSKTNQETCKDTDRHRTYVLVPRKGPKGQTQPGLTVMGVHRQGMERLFGKGWPDMMEGDAGQVQTKARL